MSLGFSRENHGDMWEVTPKDVVDFLMYRWKKLVAVALAGAFLGAGFWLLFSPYVASIGLRNNAGLGVLSIKSLQARLPNLAAEIVEKNRIPEGKADIYRSMSGARFWRGAIIPVLSLTKADIKDLGVDIKDTNNDVLFLLVESSGYSSDAAMQNSDNIAEFFRQGGAYIAIRDLFSAQQADFLSSQAKIESKMNLILVELEYQKTRLKSLEELGKRFPVESRFSSQVIDPKDSGAKYLPINTQIIATNTDINNNNESLLRLKDQLNQAVQEKRWLEASSNLIEKNYNGIELVKNLLVLEEKFRSEIRSADPKDYAFVDSLRSSLVSIDIRFGLGLAQDGMSVGKKSGILLFSTCGLVVALLMFLAFQWQYKGRAK